MTDDFAIECKGLSKCFAVYKNPKDRLKQAFSRNHKKYYQEFWAVKNINLNIKKGETVGVVGGNGSGKSTLLQLICGTLTPTHGTVQTSGRISALLELGSGFNPEFTGIENIYLYGSILGLKKKDIELALEEIISFADIGDFIYQPIKSYSSGMKVRLAFGVAINIKPEIMIIDEALSVGDERFQRKCYSKIEEIREAGASILFVSHSANTIINLCDRALLMHKGSLICSEEPKIIISYYQKILYAPTEKKERVVERIKEKINSNPKKNRGSGETSLSKSSNILNEESSSNNETCDETYDENLKPKSTIKYEENGAQIKNPIIRTIYGKIVNTIKQGNRYTYEYTVDFTTNTQNINFGMLVKNQQGFSLGGSTSFVQHANSGLDAKAGDSFLVKFEFDCLLNEGIYFLNAGVIGEINEEATYLSRISDAAMFKILPVKNSKSTSIVDFNIEPSYHRWVQSGS